MIRTSCLLLMLFTTAPALAQDLSVDGAVTLTAEAPSVDLEHADRLSSSATVLYGISIANFVLAGVGGGLIGYAFTTRDPGEDGLLAFISGMAMTSVAGLVGIALLIPAIVLDIDSGNARRGRTSLNVGPGSLGLTTTF